MLVILLYSAITKGALLPTTSPTLHEIHLVRCLTHISHKYFAPGRSLLISSPASYGDVHQELIAVIQRTAIWPVVVTADGNISNPDKKDFIDGDGGYVILIPDGDIESLKIENIGLPLVRNEFAQFWNSETRFVVAGANEFSMSQLKDIFDFFSKFRIYNCIIVRLEQYVISKEYGRQINVNNVDTVNNLEVYTWFPYQSSNICTEVNDITLLDSWINSAQGHFINNTELFPQKIRNSLNGCPMKAIVLDGDANDTTNYIYHKDSNGSVVMKLVGLEMDLLWVVLQHMNMTFVHVTTPENLTYVKGRLTDDLFWAMISKEAFIALGDLQLDSILYSYFDCTNTYDFFSIRWYVPCFVKNPRWSSIFRILSLELWIILIISIVTAAISATLVGRYSCTSEWQGYKTLSSSLTNVWAVILGVSVSTMPRAPSLRSLFLAWVCFSLAFSTVFQAFLTSFLIDSGYKTPIQNMDELFASGINLAYPQEYSMILDVGDKTEASKVLRNRVDCPSFEVCVKWAMYQKNVSVMLSDLSAEERNAFGTFVGQNSEPLLCKLEDGIFLQTGRTIIMLHIDPLMRRVTEVVGRVVEAGLYNYWISLKLNRYKILSHKISLVHPFDGYYSFNLYHMQPAFYLLLMGWCLSALWFIVELLYSRVCSKRN